MAIWIFVTLIQPLVFIVVWRTVAGSGETGGYTADQFVAYFLVMMVVDHLTFIWTCGSSSGGSAPARSHRS